MLGIFSKSSIFYFYCNASRLLDSEILTWRMFQAPYWIMYIIIDLYKRLFVSPGINTLSWFLLAQISKYLLIQPELAPVV